MPEKPLSALLRHLEIIVVEADRAEAERHQQRRDHVDVGKIGPEQRGADDAGKDHQAAHGRRAGLLEMRLRTVGADRLALALPDAQRLDDRRSEQEDDESGGEESGARTEGNVSEQVQKFEMVRQFDKPDQHSGPLVYPIKVRVACRQMARTCQGARRRSCRNRSPDDDFTINTSPGATEFSTYSVKFVRRLAVFDMHAVRQANPSAPPFPAREPDMFDAGRKQRHGKLGMDLLRIVAHLQHVAEHGDAAPAAGRARPPQAARSPRASRPDWRCSFRRSA